MLVDNPVYANVPIVDVERAKKFYREILELKEIEIPMPDGGLFEAAKGTQIFIYKREKSKAEHTVASWVVSDIHAEVSALTEKGVKFEIYDMPGVDKETGIVTNELGSAAWFKDTEGNILGLYQYE